MSSDDGSTIATPPAQRAGALSALASDEAEAARQLGICNACRYCEGYCAVFPAMTRRLEFGRADIHYLANLCHNCGACYHACQYAPPHEFAVNIPRAMATVRVRTYEEYAWPRALGGLYRRNAVVLALAVALAVALFLLAAIAIGGRSPGGSAPGDFYAVFSHGLLVWLFGGAFAYAVLAFCIGAARFWRGQTPGPASAAAAAESAHHALALTYLDGGHGDGCNEEDDRFTLVRRRYHHITFYGFLLCFASTVTATAYHYGLELRAPYAVASLPVVLGIVGGTGLLIGPAGLLWLNIRRDPALRAAGQAPMDRAFAVLLALTSATGLALLVWRDTPAMAGLLAVHLGVVMAFFLTLPYGKFAHGVYRTAALLKWAIERRQPNPIIVKLD